MTQAKPSLRARGAERPRGIELHHAAAKRCRILGTSIGRPGIHVNHGAGAANGRAQTTLQALPFVAANCIDSDVEAGKGDRDYLF